MEKPDNSFVAFTAGLSKNFTRTTKNNGIIVYDKVQLKYPPTSPNGYSSQTGVFTATTSGMSCLSQDPFLFIVVRDGEVAYKFHIKVTQ